MLTFVCYKLISDLHIVETFTPTFVQLGHEAMDPTTFVNLGRPYGDEVILWKKSVLHQCHPCPQ